MEDNIISLHRKSPEGTITSLIASIAELVGDNAKLSARVKELEANAAASEQMQQDAEVGRTIRDIPPAGGMFIQRYSTTGHDFEIYLSTTMVINKGRGTTPRAALIAAGLITEKVRNG